MCIGTNLVDLGALSNFWYGFRPREEIYDLLERRRLQHHPLGGNLLQAQVRFDEVRRAFQVPAVRSGVQILGELPETGGLLSRGHLPGRSIQGAAPVRGGSLIAAVDDVGGRTFLLDADGRSQR